MLMNSAEYQSALQSVVGIISDAKNQAAFLLTTNLMCSQICTPRLSI